MDYLQEARERYEMATREQNSFVSARNCARAQAAALIAIAEELRYNDRIKSKIELDERFAESQARR